MGRNIIKGAMLLAASIALSACATGDRSIGEASGISVTELTELPLPASASSRFSPMSVLEITVAQDESLTGTYVVDETGMLDFPLIGEVAALGLSPTQLASVIASRLSGQFVVDPSVTVSPVNAVAPTVSIGGEVSRPGTYPIANATSLMRAINSAGGLDDYAREDDVLVFREVNGQRYIGVYDFEAIIRGNIEDPRLIEGDIVMVGDNPGQRRFEQFLQILPAVTSSLVLLDRIGN